MTYCRDCELRGLEWIWERCKRLGEDVKKVLEVQPCRS